MQSSLRQVVSNTVLQIAEQYWLTNMHSLSSFYYLLCINYAYFFPLRRTSNRLHDSVHLLSYISFLSHVIYDHHSLFPNNNSSRFSENIIFFTKQTLEIERFEIQQFSKDKPMILFYTGFLSYTTFINFHNFLIC